jgi:D-glycero-D-manno-heptose 1,7-bisphosphate phosphatase
MGRYQTKISPSQNFDQQSLNQQFDPQDWPTEFPKCVIGIDRDGVINEWKNVIKRYEDVQFIEGSLEAIRKLRLKRHRVVLFADQPNITKGLLSDTDVNNIMNHMMQIFGQNGIFSIDGFYFNQSDMPQDTYAKPNIGMLRRAENEMRVDFSSGYYVGDTIDDIKMALKIGAIPVLVRTGKGAATEEKYLKSFDTKYKDVKVFDNLLEFVKSL